MRATPIAARGGAGEKGGTQCGATMPRGKAPPDWLSTSPLRLFRRVLLDEVVVRIQFPGGVRPENRLAVGGVGLGAILRKHFELRRVDVPCGGQRRQFEAAPLEVFAGPLRPACSSMRRKLPESRLAN